MPRPTTSPIRLAAGLLAVALVANTASASSLGPGAPGAVGVVGVVGVVGAASGARPARELLLELTETPRLAGTSGSAWGAELVARRLAEAGFEVEVDEREVMLSLPREIELQVFGDGFATRPALERLSVFDPHAVPAGEVPPFNAWAASGDVRGPVVDVGYGLRADYERLAAAGVDVRGRVALARYGRAYRGVKVDLATENGAIAVLLFNDPRDDGAERGDVWPEGPWKPDWDVQRGSISPMGRSPGDPTTPGWASPAPGEDSERPRLDGEALAAALPTIPCVPLPAREARVILERLAEARLPATDDADAERRPIGPGPVEVRVRLDQPRELTTIRNVIGRLPGRQPGLVLAGNHRDAWVRGAHDAGSGTVALLRAAQRLGARAADGWRPERTIALAFWDAEEFSLVGSTEWGEAHAELLTRELVAYLNADAAVTGTHLARLSGTPGLLGTVERALERVPAGPDALGAEDGTETLWDELVAYAQRAGRQPRLGLPGSGSDFTVFLHHLNLPVLDFGLSGNRGGQYHTSFDDFAMVERFLDPGFVGHELAGQLVAELLSELASAGDDALDPREAAAALAVHARELSSEPPFRGATSELNDRWRAGLVRLATAFEDVAEAAAGDVRRDLYAHLAAPDGLAGRPWFKNRLWAPGLETGYSSERFPSLRTAARESTDAFEAELEELIGSVRGLVVETESPARGR